jgi:hypothetical protein
MAIKDLTKTVQTNLRLTSNTPGTATTGALQLPGINLGSGSINAAGAITSAKVISASHSAQDASGTNVVGQTINISSGASTGNAAAAPITFSGGTPGASGSTPQPLVERMRIAPSGNVIIGSANDTFLGRVQVTGLMRATSFSVFNLNTAPASATAAGVTGEIRFSNGFIYLCVATNTWQRVAIATW